MGYFTDPALAQAAGAVLLEEIEVGAGISSVTFDEIPDRFQTLWLMGMFGGHVNTRLRVGTGGVIDTGANYRYAANLDGETEATGENNAGTYAEAFGLAAVADGGAGWFTSVEILFPGYASTDNYKPWIARCSGLRSSGADRHGQAGGIWLNNTDPLDIIEIGSIAGLTGDLTAGSFLQLYGVGRNAV